MESTLLSAHGNTLQSKNPITFPEIIFMFTSTKLYTILIFFTKFYETRMNGSVHGLYNVYIRNRHFTTFSRKHHSLRHPQWGDCFEKSYVDFNWQSTCASLIFNQIINKFWTLSFLHRVCADHISMYRMYRKSVSVFSSHWSI